MQRILEARATGGKHVVKMTKPGERLIIVPMNIGRDYSRGMRDAILKQVSRLKITVPARLWPELARGAILERIRAHVDDPVPNSDDTLKDNCAFFRRGYFGTALIDSGLWRPWMGYWVALIRVIAQAATTAAAVRPTNMAARQASESTEP